MKRIFHIAEAVYALLVLAWYVLPFVSPSLGGFDPLKLAQILYGSPPSAPGAWLAVTVLVYLAPVISLWKIASFFLEKALPLLADPERPISIALNIVSSGVVAALVVLHLVSQARSGSYFAAFPRVTYAMAGLSVAYNACFIVMLIGSISRRDAAYVEYLEFRQVEGQAPRSALSAAQRQGIQRKLLLTFVPLILVIILVLAFFLLRDFRSTILAAVEANGEGLAERTASVVKANPGDKDRISLEDYFGAEQKKNAAAAGQSSSFAFRTLSFYRRDAKTGGFELWESTDPKDIGKKFPALATPLTKTTSRYNPAANAYEFLAPVTLSNTFIGYIIVDYAREVIYEPYFRTQVKVFTIAALFMYISVFLIYIFGRTIVIPILFLRMSVNTIAQKLSGMIKGAQRPSAELLQFKDRVNTRDEIKGLSDAVGNMTAVIRGVIPYISTSTLKHAGQASPSSKNQELACLFTDIRGFTEMSEGTDPDKLVAMLNHYLEIETAIIHANGGDVDKYVGDAVFARFDGKHKEINACKAGLEIRRAMAEEARKAKAAAQKVIEIGIGINAGMVTFGSVGAQDRKDYTAIGDNVNLASRLESATKQYHTKSLISESVYEKVKDEFLCREIDATAVKGKEDAVRIFEIIREKKGATDRDERFKKLFETSLTLYRKQKWDSAEKGFTAAAKEFDDETSELFLERIASLRKNPPPRNWDGVFKMTSK
jgi:class 3 adenylate cyclase